MEREPVSSFVVRAAVRPAPRDGKVSDEFTVPLCRAHHRDNHSSGDEVAWWERRAIDPIATARMLWVSTRQSNDNDTPGVEHRYRPASMPGGPSC